MILDEIFYGDEKGNVGSENTVKKLPKDVLLDAAEYCVRDVIKNLELKREQKKQDIWNDLCFQIKKRAGR